MSTNLYKHNLEVLINLHENETLKNFDNRLEIDKRYLKGWRSGYPIKESLEVFKISFYHYLNLIHLPLIKLSKSCTNLAQLTQQEYRLGIICLLEKSLEGLFRLEQYYRYYNLSEQEDIKEVNQELTQKLVNIKSATLGSDPESEKVKSARKSYLNLSKYYQKIGDLICRETEPKPKPEPEYLDEDDENSDYVEVTVKSNEKKSYWESFTISMSNGWTKFCGWCGSSWRSFTSLFL